MRLCAFIGTGSLRLCFHTVARGANERERGRERGARFISISLARLIRVLTLADCVALFFCTLIHADIYLARARAHTNIPAAIFSQSCSQTRQVNEDSLASFISFSPRDVTRVTPATLPLRVFPFISLKLPADPPPRAG